MKTKLTFLAVAIVALLGVGMLMAFKQEEKHKKYITIFGEINYVSLLKNKYYVIDEDSKGTSVKIENVENVAVITNRIINEYSAKGYKLFNFSVKKDVNKDDFIILFEKE